MKTKTAEMTVKRIKEASAENVVQRAVVEADVHIEIHD